MSTRRLALFLCGSFLAPILVQAAVAGAEPRLVVDEFQEKLARISELTTFKSPDAVNFPPSAVRFLRVAILETDGTGQPGIDELEVFGPEGKENLALAERGAVASASSLLPGYPIHQIKHLNDGLYGNDHSWIAATSGPEWVQIEWPQPVTVGGRACHPRPHGRVSRPHSRGF